MTLFINGNNLNNPFWGLPRVAFELISSIDRLVANKDVENPFGDIVLLGRDKASPLSDLKIIKYEYLAAPNLYYWENVALALRTGRSPLLGLQNRNPVVKENCATMIHGLQVLTQPGSYSRRAKIEARTLLPLSGLRHRTILTVSEFSATEIASHGIAKRSKIEVIYNGIDHKQVRSKDTSKQALPYLVGRSYVLAQGTTRSHKNIGILLRAFEDPQLRDIQLVLFGEHRKEDFIAAGHPVPDNVLFLGMVGDDVLATLLKNALCLAFPSLTEGFGLPPLEAMSLGTPAVVSNGGAIPEVCGQSALVVDAKQPAEWVRAIRSLRDDPELWQKHSSLGVPQAAKFTWDASGRKLFEVMTRRHSPH